MCLTPLQLKRDDSIVPCGVCPQCKKRRASGWSFRLQEEEKRSDTAIFLTLTYDNDHVPLTEKKFLTLNKVHVQNFFKRLRYYEKGKKIKYYACGEYGTESWRPHYHAILFNATEAAICKAWMEDGQSIGTVWIDAVTADSIGYVLKYIQKPKRVPAHYNDDRLPEFSLMSKRLGDNYITESMRRWHTDNLVERMYCTLPGGFKVTMCRYYKDKIYTEEQREVIAEFNAVNFVRLKEKREKDLYKKYGDNWPYVVKEQIEVAFAKMDNILKDRKKV